MLPLSVLPVMRIPLVMMVMAALEGGMQPRPPGQPTRRRSICSTSPPRSGHTPSNQPLRHIPKAPATLGKLGEGPFRHYLSLLQQYNPVTVPYRALGVGVDDYRLLRTENLDCLPDCQLCD